MALAAATISLHFLVKPNFQGYLSINTLSLIVGAKALKRHLRTLIYDGSHFGAIQSEPHPVFASANTPLSLARLFITRIFLNIAVSQTQRR